MTSKPKFPACAALAMAAAGSLAIAPRASGQAVHTAEVAGAAAATAAQIASGKADYEIACMA